MGSALSGGGGGDGPRDAAWVESETKGVKPMGSVVGLVDSGGSGTVVGLAAWAGSSGTKPMGSAGVEEFGDGRELLGEGAGAGGDSGDGNSGHLAKSDAAQRRASGISLAITRWHP